jgi:hypothetical protein
MIILGFAGVGFHGVSNEEQDGAERRVGNSIDFGRPPSGGLFVWRFPT